MITKYKKRFLISLGLAIPMILGSMFFVFEPDPEVVPTAMEVVASGVLIAGYALCYFALFFLAKAKGYPGIFGLLAVLFLGPIGILVAIFAPDKTRKKSIVRPQVVG